jgi:hypothetical protein
MTIVMIAAQSTFNARRIGAGIQRSNKFTLMCFSSQVIKGREQKIKIANMNVMTSKLPLMGLLKARPVTSTVVSIIIANITNATSPVSAPRILCGGARPGSALSTFGRVLILAAASAPAP